MSDEILENLRKAVIEYDLEGAAIWAKKAVEAEVDPIKSLDALIEAIRLIGDRFGRGELWLPDLVGASEAMLAATPIIEEEIEKRGVEKESLGTVVIGTVYGDVHTIGKAMVSTLLMAEGFQVYDLGVNVEAGEFVEAIKKHNVDILAMSALMTTTISQQVKVIETLKEEGLRETVKIMVGGGGVTKEFAESIGADGYDPTAPGAVKLARRLIGQSEEECCGPKRVYT
jgi:corrinoid protein of di/trimethylamine methyltransferase